ncbi:Uncharacterised protein [Mycobacteroides abscessus subsp. abscessus]|nr:Uncharacterised protein [Mycobacteroides abscessus subsp. abscessus]
MAQQARDRVRPVPELPCQVLDFAARGALRFQGSFTGEPVGATKRQRQVPEFDSRSHGEAGQLVGNGDIGDTAPGGVAGVAEREGSVQILRDERTDPVGTDHRGGRERLAIGQLDVGAVQAVPNIAYPGAVADGPGRQPVRQNRQELIAVGDRDRLAHGLGELSTGRLPQNSPVVPAHGSGLDPCTCGTHVSADTKRIARC